MDINNFLKDITYNSTYVLLEEGKDDSELKAIAEKRGIVLPAKDLAVFKCIYAFTDRVNLNGCSLPKEEVEKSLQTLVGKAIDFDHIRGRIVGSWIDAIVEGNKIIAYGIFFKGNLQEDYDIIQELLKNNQLMISFEAYGNREFKDNGTYNLNDIEWAGGALLIDTKPAFPGAAVLEMAQKERVLEFAKVMTPPKSYVHSSEERYLEKARFHITDLEAMMRMMGEVKCPGCEQAFSLNPDMIDFENSKAKVTCGLCKTKASVDFTPPTTMMKPGRNIKEVKKMMEQLKKDIGPSRGEISKTDETTNKGEIKMTEEKKEETSSEEIVKSDEESALSPAEDLKKDEVEATEEVKAEEKKEEAKDKVEEVKLEEKPSLEASKDSDEVKKLKEEIELLKAEIQKKDEELKVKVEEAKKQTATLIERKNVLGEMAKDMKDEDILDDNKFEISRLKKENSDLKKVKMEKSSLEIGGEEKKDEVVPEKKDEVKGTKEDKELALQKKIHGKAWKS